MPPSTSPTRLRRARSTLSLCLVAALALPLLAWASDLEVSVDGDAHRVDAGLGTVAAVLADLDIDVGPYDEVVPALGHELRDGMDIEVHRAITLDVVVDDQPARSVIAPVSSVAGALEAAGLDDVRERGAEVVPGWTAPVADGDEISVRYPATVTFIVDGHVRAQRTLTTTVGGALADGDVDVGPDDVVFPPRGVLLDQPITEVVVQRVEVAESVEEIVLPHDEVRRETDELEQGDSRVVEEGSDGLRIDRYEVTTVDGVERERTPVSRQVVTDPVDRIVEDGTRAPALPPAPAGVPALDDPVWDRLASCESNNDWTLVSANGLYYGGLQFHPVTWRKVGGTGMPNQASRTEQIRRAQLLLDEPWATWRNQWPACSRMLGLG